MYGQDIISILFGAVIVIAIIVAIFLLFRNLVLWYYKIDKIVEQQERMVQALERLSPPPQLMQAQVENATESDSNGKTISAKWICPVCHHENYWTAKVCTQCGAKQPGIV